MDSGRQLKKKSFIHHERWWSRYITVTDQKKRKYPNILFWHYIYSVFSWNIGTHQVQYERSIKGLKMDGFDVLVYAQNSPTNTSNKGLQTIPQNMINCLRFVAWLNLFTSPQPILPRARAPQEIWTILTKNY